MNIYSSREPFNDDPQPYVTYADDRRTEVRSKEWDIQSDGAVEYVRVYEPRPEHDRPQHNPTNPILVARRNNPGENIYYRDLERWPTEAEKDHARKVLTRLAALKEES